MLIACQGVRRPPLSSIKLAVPTLGALTLSASLALPAVPTNALALPVL